MGWWKMGPRGGLASNYLNDQEWVMGDGPADLMDIFLGPTKGQAPEIPAPAMKAALNGDMAGVPEHLREKVETLRREVIQPWRDDYGRDPYPEELIGLVDFCYPR